VATIIKADLAIIFSTLSSSDPGMTQDFRLCTLIIAHRLDGFQLVPFAILLQVLTNMFGSWVNASILYVCWHRRDTLKV
jgi:hypothetical protein